MKCADISNTVRPLHLAREWSNQIQQEMFNQGDLERKLGLPVSAFMDRFVSGSSDEEPFTSS